MCNKFKDKKALLVVTFCLCNKKRDCNSPFFVSIFLFNCNNQTNQFTVFIGLPAINAVTLFSAIFISRLRAAAEAHAICGVMKQLRA